MFDETEGRAAFAVDSKSLSSFQQLKRKSGFWSGSWTTAW